MPQVEKTSHYYFRTVRNVDSSNIHPSFWTTLIEAIIQRKDEFDGFVVTHGTDTMAYSASAVSFALRNIPNSIVFTGAQKPVEDSPSDAVNNLINAVIVASRFNVGVSIVFGPKILQGNRSTKVSESSLDAFDSPMVAPWCYFA